LVRWNLSIFPFASDFFGEDSQIIANHFGKEVSVEDKSRSLKHFLLLPAAILILLPWAWGCATSNGKLSNEKISLGEKMIQDAKESNASLNAPAELKTAEENLARAREALDKKDYKRAVHLAEQAAVDAEYARVKADSEKAKKTAEEMKKNIKALQQEIERLPK
jgi:hypothetical protein